MQQVKKIEKLNRVLGKLQSVSEREIRKGHYDCALQAIESSAKLQYMCNQVYTDDALENQLLTISNTVFGDRIKCNQLKKTRKVVLFYDSFGLDRRGLVLIYANAIIKNGYKLIYVTSNQAIGKQPTLDRMLVDTDVEKHYIDMSTSYLKWAEELFDVFSTTNPDFAYFYTTPWDVAGTVVFNSLKGMVFRCLLDLTDHAFWLGVNAFDIVNGGREYSASIQHYYRGIPLEKMTKLDGNLYTDDVEFEGLPFDESCRYIFSGGSLYKTLGDPDLTYYWMVSKILEDNKEIKFLYAGAGDTSQIDILKRKYPQRVFLIEERKDFYQIIERCTLYLNTYPMFGGLMTRYAADAGKIPLTLVHNNDADDILIRQKERRIEYQTPEELVKDVNKLLRDEEYLKFRESLLQGSVVPEETFIRNVKKMIEEHSTEFEYSEVEEIDTAEFRKEYLNRFDNRMIVNSIVDKKNSGLIKYFPLLFVKRIWKKLVRL